MSYTRPQYPYYEDGIRYDPRSPCASEDEEEPPKQKMEIITPPMIEIQLIPDDNPDGPVRLTMTQERHDALLAAAIQRIPQDVCEEESQPSEVFEHEYELMLQTARSCLPVPVAAMFTPLRNPKAGVRRFKRGDSMLKKLQKENDELKKLIATMKTQFKEQQEQLDYFHKCLGK